MRCPKCGNEISEGQNFCTNCGTKVLGTQGIKVVKGVSKGFYLGSIICAAVLSYIFEFSKFGAIVFSNAAYPEYYGELWELRVSDIMSSVLYTYSFVVSLILLYKAWASIQGRYARTTPCKAVGFSFIPLFNFYWNFMVYWGFAVDYNKFLFGHRVVAPRRNESIFLVYCLLMLLGAMLSGVLFLAFLNNGMSVIGLVWRIPISILLFIVINQTCDGINNLARFSSDSGSKSASIC